MALPPHDTPNWDMRTCLEAQDADRDGEECDSQASQMHRTEDLDKRSLALAHEQTRVALIEELARLHLELEECQQAPSAHARNSKAISHIWEVLRQCQIKQQLHVQDVDVIHPAFELTSSVRDMFRAIDADGNGFLSVREVREALSGFGQTLVSQAVETMRRTRGAIDDDQVEISEREFESGVVPLLQG